MTLTLSLNTQAILLLTAPLIAGQGPLSPDLLSSGEYKRFARRLHEMQRQPADLLSSDATELLRACQPFIEENRLSRLLGRGFLLSQAIERWQARAIWVVSRADAAYPRRLKARLRENAPAVLYGCGNIGLLESGGLAVVGSRHVDDALVDYTMGVGRLAAQARITIVSGGARGIDQAAMRGSLEAGGKVSGILANLERAVMNREYRNSLIQGQLVLISPYDPKAGFNVGNAMQRNKLIYALADAALVVNSDLNKGGTWTGAKEQLEKFRLVPVYVRSTGKPSDGLDALRERGAIPWPNPQGPNVFATIFDVAEPTSVAVQSGLSFPSNDELPILAIGTKPGVAPSARSMTEGAQESLSSVAVDPELHQKSPAAEEASAGTQNTGSKADSENMVARADLSPADVLFAAVREVIPQLLQAPMKEAEIAAALEVSKAQARTWLHRLVDDGVLDKHNKPAGYIVKQSGFFE